MHPTFYGRLKQNFIGVLFLLVLVLGMAAYRTNQEGVTGRWTVYLEEVLDDLGIVADVDEFQYSFKKGLILRGVTVFSPEEPGKVIAEFSQVELGFDLKMASEGDFHAERLALSGGKAWIELYDEEKNKIFIEEIQCEINLTRGYDVVIESCMARVHGMEVKLRGESIALLQPKDKKSPIEVPEVLRDILRHIHMVTFPQGTPPQVEVVLFHKFDAEDALKVEVSFISKNLEYNGLEWESLKTELYYEDLVVHITLLEGYDDVGRFMAKGAYAVDTLEGDFLVDSTANIPQIVRRFGIESYADNIVSPLPPAVKGAAKISGKQEEGQEISWSLATHGHLNLSEFRLLGTQFRSLDTDFSFRGEELYLRDMKVLHDKGTVEGSIVFLEDEILYNAKSNLPANYYQPFIEAGGILAENIALTTFKENSTLELELKGAMNKEHLDDWQAHGRVKLENISYNGVPLEDAECEFNFTAISADFKGVEATFNYSDYTPSRYAERQPSRGVVFADNITYDAMSETVTIQGLAGRVWPAQLVNLFSSEVGGFIDEIVYFTEPPAFKTNGVIGLEGHEERTNLVNEFVKPVDLYYTLLEEDVRFNQLSSSIRLLGQTVVLDNIRTEALSGSWRGSVEVLNPVPAHPEGGFSGEIAFTKVDLDALAETYKFTNTTPGKLTGHVNFSGLPEKVRSLNGKGFIGLDKADLFYIPIFGPLSSVFSGILGHKKASHEKVRSVVASFVIKDGTLLTNDLTSQTPSAKITGDGKVDLLTQEIDLTVRASTQGFLGLVTLPIKPLEKLLQFRGTGTVAQPVWKYSPLNASPKYLTEKPEMNKAILVE